ncbi:hypothetical protein DNTS_023979 [Danionella cerebrum]|uniref:Cytochrome P450 n=1 Tax=Danionella cerebrum TaxID=2873325 RepID=A0A553MV84_9TELE|nr:hypothetical protein DNTS_023979 [Danionella translucida]TRY57100.1 hypothetical protein DNTS_023979 [Danionella translucida]
MDTLFRFYEWIDGKSVLLFLIVFLFLSDYLKNKVPKNFPPGPWSLPIIGDIHHIDLSNIHLQLGKFAERYGKIFSLRMFGPRIVVLNGYNLVKEVYIHQGDILTDRAILPLFHDIIADNGRPFHPRLLVNNAVANVICTLVFGNRFEYSDHDFQTLLKNINETVLLEGTICAQLYNMFPWIMRWLPGSHKRVNYLWRKLINFVRGKVNEHRVDYDPSNPRDYIDCFLTEMENLKDDTAAGFDVENLCICSLDLFVAGTETTATTLYWGLLFMIKYPEIQAKIHEEIDRVVGDSRQPSLSDKDNMPYTNAVIHEIQRMANIFPINLPRITSEETQMGRYSIPKGTVVTANLTSVLFDESEWETPHSFNPGHFLDAEGKIRRRDAFLPFSLGKRVCLGEQLARMELFLFFSSLLHSFTFSSPPGVEPSLDYDLGATLCPKAYKLCAALR